ncbi:MAG TPA: hypothetical protein VF267_04660 [Gammaproteobacteria bacterium]
MRLQKRLASLAGLGLAFLFCAPANAEPWLAVQQGMKCGGCHVNATGGGMRNEYGNIYAQMTLAARQFAGDDAPWTGRLNDYVGAGGNLRANANFTDIPDQDSQLAFDLEETRLYLLFSPVPGRLDVYLDQRIAPGGSLNLEAYARYWSSDHDWYIKAGQMYLPFGLRLEDDSAFIRQTPGINFNTPDTGVEFGWEAAQWSTQIAVSNGTAGGPELDTGKQLSLRSVHVQPGWRAGASVNVNDTDAGERNMQNVFAGLRTGSIAWLAEIDFIQDGTVGGGELTQQVGLVEANWLFRKGHNLKVTAEFLDPNTDIDDDEQNRYSVAWEYFPMPYMQMRLGTRTYDGITGEPLQNHTLVFLQVHGYF